MKFKDIDWEQSERLIEMEEMSREDKIKWLSQEFGQTEESIRTDLEASDALCPCERIARFIDCFAGYGEVAVPYWESLAGLYPDHGTEEEQGEWSVRVIAELRKREIG